MNAVLNIGKYLYIIPFAAFGLFHFMNTEMLASFAPGGAPMVYVTGVALLAATISMLIGKFDKLAATLLGVMLLLFVFILHLPGAMDGDQNSTTQLLKDTMLSGAAFIYARYVARDNAVIGG